MMAGFEFYDGIRNGWRLPLIMAGIIDTRWWILICCCCIVFFPAFFDFQISALVQRLTGRAEECRNGTDTCRNFTLYQFNILSSMDYWTRAVAGVLAGIIIDQYGTKLALWACAAGIIVSTWVIQNIYIFQASTKLGQCHKCNKYPSFKFTTNFSHQLNTEL